MKLYCLDKSRSQKSQIYLRESGVLVYLWPCSSPQIKVKKGFGSFGISLIYVEGFCSSLKNECTCCA